ncbi:hypothetical protein PC120_g20949 [Phytophthora cactorum]|nr:hypothetical protein PC120_g20949 [Phytophthora cactorum]
MSKVKNDIISFFQFNYTWYDDAKAKQGKQSFERLLGWAHPELRNRLRYDSGHRFVDETFRSAPKGFHQFITLMMYDPLTELFVHLFFTLATSQTQDLYKKLFQCIEFAVGVKPTPKDVVCDFEAALIFAVRDHFPSTRIIGCLLHFKQACRRKMKKYQLSETEAGIAMGFGLLYMLTVIDAEKISVQGVAWVKNKIKQRCGAQNVPYSRSKWNQFWNYFQKTWIETFPPDLWNIYGVQREIVNRTNNSLERFHHEVNARPKRRPSLRPFFKTIEEIARHYQLVRKSIITDDAEAPKRPGLRFPRAATLPSITDIQNSESEDESDSDSIDDNNHEEDPQLADEDLELSLRCLP